MKPRRLLRSFTAGAWLTGLALSGLLTYLHETDNQREAQAQLTGAATQSVKSLTDQLQVYEFGIRGARGAAVASGVDRFDRQRFTDYSRSRDFDKEFPGALGIGIVRRVVPGGETAFVQRVRQAGLPDFDIQQFGQHQGEHLIIEQIEPSEGNQASLGLDLAGDPALRSSAIEAMQTGNATLTRPLQDDIRNRLNQPTFLLLMPIYRPDAPLNTAADRERACIGWIHTPLIASDVFKGLDFAGGQVSIELLDMTRGDTAPLFSNVPPADESRGMVHTIDFQAFGRALQARVRPNDRFFYQLHHISATSMASLLVGLSTLLAVLLHLLLTARDRARQVYEVQTQRAGIVECSPDAVIVQSLDGRVIDWNPGAQKLFGFTPDEAVGKVLANLILPPERRHEERDLLNIIARGQPIEPFETTRLRSDGSMQDVSVAVAALMDPNGNCVGAAKVIRDISAARQAQQALADLNNSLERLVHERTSALQAAQHDLRNIMDAVPTIIAYWDRDLINRMANRACCDWFGIAAESLHGMHMLDVLGSELFALNVPYVEAALAGESLMFERTIRTAAHKAPRYAAVYYTPDIVEGNVVGFYVVAHDLTELNQSRTELALARRNSAALLETIRRHTIVSFTDWAGNIIDLNDYFCEISGYSRDELIGENHRIIRSGHHEQAFWGQMWSTIIAGQSWRGEVCNRSRTGDVYWVDSIISPILGADGEIAKFISIQSDITQRKRLESDLVQAHQRLESQERFLRNLTDRLPVRISYQDQALRFQFVNAAYADYLGVERQTIIGRTRSEIDGIEADAQEANFYEAVLKGSPMRVELDEQIGERLVSMDTQLVPDIAPDGTVVGIFKVSTDISERRLAERELRKTLQLLDAVLAAASQIAIIAVRTDGIISLVNSGAEKMLGYERDELLDNFHVIRLHDQSEMQERSRALSEQSGRPIPPDRVFVEPSELGHWHEWSYVRKDGTCVPVSMSVTAIQDEQGNMVGYLGIAHDVRLQKAQEKSLREAVDQAKQANQAKTLFLANMSHEIRTPMNAVIGLSYLLERTTLDSEQASLLSKILLASKSLLSLINNILDLSKIEARELKIEHVGFSPATLLREIHALMSVQASAKGIDFQLNLPVELPPFIEGDPTRLHQILTNLLTNAIKFTESGSVTLKVEVLFTSPESTRLGFTVKDTGIGITPQQLQSLFTPFVQADASTTRRFGGTGLGLSIVRELVQLMSGELDVRSEPGRGSEFSFALNFRPALQAWKPPAAETASEGQQLIGLRVLVTDDSEVNLEVARRMLELEGAQVSLAHHGQEAVDMLLAGPSDFDIVLLDLQMPVLDGFDTSRRIRSGLGLKDLPIIALSASTLSSEMALARDAGVNDFITKPFEASTLTQRVRQWCRHEASKADTPPERSAAVPDGRTDHVHWPDIEGIDMRGAQRRLGGDLDLFCTMFKRLVAEFAAMELDSTLPLEADLADLASHMHKLKGGAGTLGVRSLEESARRAEEACRQGRADQAHVQVREVGALLRHLQLHAVLEIERLEKPLNQPPATTESTLRPEAVTELLAMFGRSDLAAIEQFSEIEPQLSSLLDPASLRALHEQVHNLQFAEAAAALQRLGICLDS